MDRRNRPAFTPIELLAVTAIIAQRVALLMPLLKQAKDLARAPAMAMPTTTTMWMMRT